MRLWNVPALDIEPRKPQILSSDEAARAIALDLPAGKRLSEHEVHEHAWLVVLAGELELSAPGTKPALATTGTVAEFEPQERREVIAKRDARVLLLLTPWPGMGHPGAMSLDDKATARARARTHLS